MFRKKYNLCSSGKQADLISKLCIAASRGDIKTVRDILDNHVDVNSYNENGGTPLYYAAAWNQLVIVAMLLLNYNADPDMPIYLYKQNKVFFDGISGMNLDPKELERLGDFTPLYIAAEHGYKKIVQALLISGANPHKNIHTYVHTKLSVDGIKFINMSPIKIAENSGYHDIVELMNLPVEHHIREMGEIGEQLRIEQLKKEIEKLKRQREEQINQKKEQQKAQQVSTSALETKKAENEIEVIKNYRP